MYYVKMLKDIFKQRVCGRENPVTYFGRALQPRNLSAETRILFRYMLPALLDPLNIISSRFPQIQYKIHGPLLKLSAYHEAGHAVVCADTKYKDGIHQLDLLPQFRGCNGALHVNSKILEDMFSPDKKETVSKEDVRDYIKILYAGHEAEKIYLDVTWRDLDGSAGDYERACYLSKLYNFSPEERENIREETKEFLEENKEALHLIAKALHTNLKLDREEIFALLNTAKHEQEKAELHTAAFSPV